MAMLSDFFYIFLSSHVHFAHALEFLDVFVLLPISFWKIFQFYDAYVVRTDLKFKMIFKTNLSWIAGDTRPRAVGIIPYNGEA